MTQTVDELNRKLGALAIARRKANHAVYAAEQAQREAGMAGLPVDKAESRALSDEVKAARQEFEAVELQLQKARADLTAAVLCLTRPAKLERLIRAKKLKAEHLKICHDIVATFNSQSRLLVALDRTSEGLLAVERLPEDRGVTGMGRTFHKLMRFHRLKFPLSKAFRPSSYAQLVYQDNLPKPHLEDFVAVETRACDSIIHDLERQINEIDDLEKERAS